MPEFDAAKFLAELKGTGELTPEEEAMLAGVVGREKAGKVFKSGFMAQSEFHSLSDRLNNEHKARLQSVVELEEEIRNSGGQSTARVTELESQLDAAMESLADVEGKLAAAKVRAKTYTKGEEFFKETGLEGIDIKKPATKPADPNPDDAPVTYGRASAALNNIVSLTFDKDEFRDEYFELTGKYPSAKEMRDALNNKEYAGRPTREILDTAFKVGDIRKQKEDERIAGLVAAARREGAEEAAAKYSIPSGSAPLGAEPPPIARALVMDRSEKPDAHMSSAQVREKAIADLRKGMADKRAKQAATTAA